MNRRDCCIAIGALLFFSGAAKPESEELSGRIASIGKNELSILAGEQAVSFTVGQKTAISLDGKPVLLDALKPGLQVTVKAMCSGGKLLALKIAARSSPGLKISLQERCASRD